MQSESRCQFGFPLVFESATRTCSIMYFVPFSLQAWVQGLIKEHDIERYATSLNRVDHKGVIRSGPLVPLIPGSTVIAFLQLSNVLMGCFFPVKPSHYI